MFDQMTEPAGSRTKNLFFGLVAGTLILLTGVLVPGLASAEEFEVPGGPELPLEGETGINCRGQVLKAASPVFPYDYKFSCDKEVRTYAIISNREIDGSDTEPVGRDPEGNPDQGVPADPTTTPPTAAVPSGDFFCVASLPGWGVSCHGRRGQSTLKAGYSIEAGFSTFDPICEASTQPKFWLVPVYEYTEENLLVTPPSIRKWLIAAEPIALNSKAVRCKVLNPSAKAKKACARAQTAKGKAKKKAKAQCRKFRQAAKASL